MLELVTAAVLALLCGRFAAQPVTLARGFLGVLGVALAAMASLALLAAHRVTLRSTVSFGPYLLGGALLGTLADGPVGYHIP